LDLGKINILHPQKHPISRCSFVKAILSKMGENGAEKLNRDLTVSHTLRSGPELKDKSRRKGHGTPESLGCRTVRKRWGRSYRIV